MLPASAERWPVALLEAMRALRADSGCGAAIGIDQSKNLGLTAAIARRSLPTISGDQFGVSWPLPAGRVEKSRATLGGPFQEGLGPALEDPTSAKKAETLPGDLCLRCGKPRRSARCSAIREVPRCLQFTQTKR